MSEKPFTPEKQFSAEEREDVFRDWATGKFGSIDQLADAYGMPQAKTIFKWIERYEWTEKRGEYLEAVFSDDKELSRVVKDANNTHMQLWKLIIGHSMNLIKPRTNKTTGKVLPVQAELLEKVSGILTRAQKGQRLAIGADLSRNEDRSKRVRVTVGESGSSSDLKVLAKEVLDQHERADQEDKKASAG